jgi:RimJ/RimL family protein N-acetyltransferase
LIAKRSNSRLSPVGEEEVNTLASWIRNKEDLHLWSGNTFSSGFSSRKMQLHLNRSDLDSFAYLNQEKKLLCYADIVRKEKHMGVLCRVIVHPDHRRQGLGKAFCCDLLNWAKDYGNYLKIHLNTFGHNKAALACYNALGFRTVSVEPKCRKVKGELQDLVVMTANLKEWNSIA